MEDVHQEKPSMRSFVMEVECDGMGKGNLAKESVA